MFHFAFDPNHRWLEKSTRNSFISGNDEKAAVEKKINIVMQLKTQLIQATLIAEKSLKMPDVMFLFRLLCM